MQNRDDDDRVQAMEVDTAGFTDEGSNKRPRFTRIDRSDRFAELPSNTTPSEAAFEAYSVNNFASIAEPLFDKLALSMGTSGSGALASTPSPASAPSTSAPPTAATGGTSKPVTDTDLLQSLLRSMSGGAAANSSSSVATKQQSTTDLDIAMQAADTASRASRFSKKDHVRYKTIAENMHHPDREVVPADKKFYAKMTDDLRVENEEFIAHQKETMLSSGIYDTLHPNVEATFQTYIRQQQHRQTRYPQFYASVKQFSLKDQPPVPEKSVLVFTKELKRQGVWAPVSSGVTTVPKKLDLSKDYLHTETSTSPPSHYQKKVPPPVSMDKMANDISENETLHIVASLESLIPLVELASSLSTTFRIPLRVAQRGDHTTLFFDAPVPNHAWSAKQRNQLVFDWAWKAAVLNWPQAISVDTKLTQTHDDTTSDSEWHHDTDENHTYNMWRFGDINVLIRHQVDGFLSADAKDGGKRHCMMSTKLDYQHQNGTDEVTTATERAVNWLRSFVAGHAIVLEARVDVPNGRVYHVHKKNMADIMGDKWRPMQESNMLHHLFHQLHSTLDPGQYMLQHMAGEAHLQLLRGMDEAPTGEEQILDLHAPFKPVMASPESAYVPAWNFHTASQQLPWTFTPRPA